MSTKLKEDILIGIFIVVVLVLILGFGLILAQISSNQQVEMCNISPTTCRW